MGSSYIEYEGAGFWTRDELIQYALAAIVREINGSSNVSPALQEAAEHWTIQSQLGGSGCVSPEFDRFVGTPGLMEQVLPLIRSAAQRVSTFGEHLPTTELEGADIGGLTDWWRDHPVPVKSVLNVLGAIEKLLQGQLATTGDADAKPPRIS
jgi:hypothetical protein